MLLETFVVVKLVKQATWSSVAVELRFYRDTEKREVDVVIESGRHLGAPALALWR